MKKKEKGLLPIIIKKDCIQAAITFDCVAVIRSDHSLWLLHPFTSRMHYKFRERRRDGRRSYWDKVYILLAACAFIFVLLTTQIEKAGNVNLPQTKPELCGIIFYAILLVIAIVSNIVIQMLYEAQNIFNSLRMKRNVKIRNKYDQAT